MMRARVTAMACLPIRLTAIATVPNLPIRTFFLASQPVTTANYSLAEIRPDGPGLWTGAQRWNSLVGQAVRELGGQAFAREYAGSPPAISVALEPVDDLATITDPSEYLDQLSWRGYAGDPYLLDLFALYLTPPDGYTGDPRDYYNCLFRSSRSACGEPATFDPVALTTAIDAEIAAPRREAERMVRSHRHLTRLSTFLAAEDMTIDPVFRQDEGLEDLSNVHVADLVTQCSEGYFHEGAPQVWRIEGEEYAGRPGTAANDSNYCTRMGRSLVAPTCPADPGGGGGGSGGGTAGGGGLCSVGADAPSAGLVLLMLAGRFGVRRLRRGRTAVRSSTDR